jgi:hypothetical protein
VIEKQNEVDEERGQERSRQMQGLWRRVYLVASGGGRGRQGKISVLGHQPVCTEETWWENTDRCSTGVRGEDVGNGTCRARLTLLNA